LYGSAERGQDRAVKYKSRRPRWIRIVVGVVILFIVLAVVGAAIGR
jgi:t-SNARE complex subunit (syntaxin)